MTQGFPTRGSSDLDAAAAAAAGRLDDNVCVKHAGDAQSVYRADRVKLSALQPNAMFGRFPGERVRIKDYVRRVIVAKQIMGL